MRSAPTARSAFCYTRPNMIIFYIIAIIVVFLGVVIGLPGGVHINPVLLHFYEPHMVLLLTTFLLTMTATCSIIIFWKHIRWNDAVRLALYGIAAGILGGYLIAIIPSKVVVALFFVSGGLFLWSHYKKKTDRVQKYGLFFSGFCVSFMQAFGISAGTLRRAYLRSRGYDFEEIYGTISLGYAATGISILATRMRHEDIPLSITYQIIILFPVVFLTIWLGKKTIRHIPKNIQDAIVIYSLILSLLLAVPYLLK